MTELPEGLIDRPPRRSGQEATATLTKDAYLRLKAELDDLTSRGRTDMAARLLIARELGDLKENSEYDEAKNAQGLMEARIRTLESKLRDPDIVEAPVDSDTALPGMLVTVLPLDEDDPEEERYLLAASADERAKGARTVSTDSPFGEALVGTKVDDEVAYEAPGGTFRYRVVGFEPHLG